MSSFGTPATSRRDFLSQSGRVAAASLLASAVPAVHAGEESTIQLALVGCGGRGTGAAADALSTKSGPIKLVAMADVFEQRLTSSHDNLQKMFGKQVDVPQERRFIGFDAYRHAMECLRPGDVVLLTTPCAFRWVHFGLAIEKGINVFMEKPTTRRGGCGMIATGSFCATVTVVYTDPRGRPNCCKICHFPRI